MIVFEVKLTLFLLLLKLCNERQIDILTVSDKRKFSKITTIYFTFMTTQKKTFSIIIIIITIIMFSFIFMFLLGSPIKSFQTHMNT